MSSLVPGQKSRELVNRWWQLLACIVAMMAIANLQYAWTLFTLPLTKSLNATLSAVQVAFTLFILAETWLVPFEGYLVDRRNASRNGSLPPHISTSRQRSSFQPTQKGPSR